MILRRFNQLMISDFIVLNLLLQIIELGMMFPLISQSPIKSAISCTLAVSIIFKVTYANLDIQFYEPIQKIHGKGACHGCLQLWIAGYSNVAHHGISCNSPK